MKIIMAIALVTMFAMFLTSFVSAAPRVKYNHKARSLFNKRLKLIPSINLRMFDNTNITTDSGMTVEMKTFYDKDLLKNAKPKLVHNEFGQKRPIPKGSGKIIEFRKFDVLAKATTPLTEGVAPAGTKMTATAITATVGQYGAYIEHSDMLQMTTIDNVVLEANRLLGQQSGETLDTLTREIINAGTNVQYADSVVAARYLLVGGDATWANNDYFSIECIRQAALTMRNNKAMGVSGSLYACILHPDAVYCLKKDSEWVEATKYQHSEKLFSGEVGEYDGVKIIQTTEAKIFHAADLIAVGSTNAGRTITCASNSGKIFTMATAISTAEALALVGRNVIVKGVLYTVASSVAGTAGTATITVVEDITGTPTTDIMYPGEAGALGRDVYSALFIGSDSYGVTEISGGGLQTIIKQLGSAGTADPLNQKATQGWKATHISKILNQLWILRVEHTTPYQRGSN